MLTHTFGSQEACEQVLNNVPGNQAAEMSGANVSSSG